ncbi:MAG TPA: ATP-binding cassette domain-containing protein [Polyangiaceae bacterium]|jgi:ATPase subunit of ABC transporter with duplicated ATPase domains|nr:ATP-binding cassette domain-containing protein [Polyangiaceae bacterium]
MIALNNVTKRYGPKVLFENVTMQFDPGKRYGLTGANGAGKSTLLEMLSGQEDWDTGSIDVPGGTRIGVLEQNHFVYDEQRILDAVMAGKSELWDAMVEKERLLSGEVDDVVGARLGELEGVIADNDGYSADGQAAELLVGLGIPAEKHGDPMRSLPAGYKLRVLIAKVLFGRPDVMLLDEPTNHLDLESIQWLTRFLVDEHKGTLLVVSHDRHFLNQVATHIADVDFKTITVYTGNYAEFVGAKYENQQRAEATAQSAKKKMGELQEFVQRFGSHASKSKQAQSRLKQIEKLEEVVETKGAKRSSLVRPYVRFEMAKPSGRDVVRVENVTKSFEGRGVVLGGMSLNVNRGDRIAVIGRSGIGKSTLLKLLVGAYKQLDDETRTYTLLPDSGDVRWGNDASVGYFAQDHHESLGATAKGTTPYDWLYQFDPSRTKEEIRGILGRLLFSGEAALKPTEALSGGEAARLLLGKMVLGRHNVLVLDEPTNHLDIESIEGLLDGLLKFEGTVLFVSHDHHFVSRLATRVIELKDRPAGDKAPGCAVTDFGGTYEEYLERHGH